MFNEEDRKWLYDQFKNNGYQTGSYEDFIKSLDNDEDFKWWHEQATGMGLEVGDLNNFGSLFRAPSEEQQKQKDIAEGRAMFEANRPTSRQAIEEVASMPSFSSKQEPEQVKQPEQQVVEAVAQAEEKTVETVVDSQERQALVENVARAYEDNKPFIEEYEARWEEYQADTDNELSGPEQEEKKKWLDENNEKYRNARAAISEAEGRLNLYDKPKDMERLREKRAEARKHNDPQTIIARGITPFGRDNTGKPSKEAQESAEYGIADDLYSMAEQTLNQGSKYDHGYEGGWAEQLWTAVKQFGQGAANNFDKGSLTFGLSEGYALTTARKVGEKYNQIIDDTIKKLGYSDEDVTKLIDSIKKGGDGAEKYLSIMSAIEDAVDEGLSDGEKAILDGLEEFTSAKMKRAEDVSVASAAGAGAEQSAEFMLDFILTGGITKAGTRAAAKLASRRLMKKLGEKGAKAVSTALTDAGVAAARTAIIFPRSVQSYGENLAQMTGTDELGRYNFDRSHLNAALNTALSQYIEYWTEGFGNYLSAGEQALFKGVTKSAPRTAIGKTLKDYRGSIGKYLDYGKFDGMFNEMMEEVAGSSLTALNGWLSNDRVGDKDAMKDFFSGEQLATLALSFLPMSAISASTNLRAYNKMKERYNDGIKVLNQFIDRGALSQEELDGLVSDIENKTPEELKDKIVEISDKVRKENGGTLPDNFAQSLMGYVEGTFVMNLNNEAWENSQEKLGVVNAYTEQFENPDEANAWDLAKIESSAYDIARAAGIDDKTLEHDPYLLAREAQAIKETEPEQYVALMGYATAKAANDGLKDGYDREGQLAFADYENSVMQNVAVDGHSIVRAQMTTPNGTIGVFVVSPDAKINEDGTISTPTGDDGLIQYRESEDGEEKRAKADNFSGAFTEEASTFLENKARDLKTYRDASFEEAKNTISPAGMSQAISDNTGKTVYIHGNGAYEPVRIERMTNNGASVVISGDKEALKGVAIAAGINTPGGQMLELPVQSLYPMLATNDNGSITADQQEVPESATETEAPVQEVAPEADLEGLAGKEVRVTIDGVPTEVDVVSVGDNAVRYQYEDEEGNTHRETVSKDEFINLMNGTEVPAQEELAQQNGASETEVVPEVEEVPEQPVAEVPEQPVVEEEVGIIPFDANTGERVYDAEGVSVDDSWNAIHEDWGNDADSESYIIEQSNEARKAYGKAKDTVEKGQIEIEEVSNLPREKGEGPAAKQRRIEAAIAKVNEGIATELEALPELERKLNHWNALRERVDQDIRRRNSQEQAEMEPKSLEEAIAYGLSKFFNGGQRLNLANVKEVSGVDDASLRRQGWSFVLSNDGLTIDNFVHNILSGDPHTRQFVTDEQEAINMVADMIMSMSRKDVGNLIADNRKAEKAAEEAYVQGLIEQEKKAAEQQAKQAPVQVEDDLPPDELEIPSESESNYSGIPDKQEGEPAKTFYDRVIDAVVAQYNGIKRGDVVRQDVSDRSEEDQAKLPNARFYYSNGKLVIFAKSRTISSDSIERSIFHEAIHRALKGMTREDRRITIALFNAALIEKGYYTQEEYNEVFAKREQVYREHRPDISNAKLMEEMLAFELSDMMVEGTAEQWIWLMGKLEPRLGENLNRILNEIGYEAKSESNSRRGRNGSAIARTARRLPESTSGNDDGVVGERIDGQTNGESSEGNEGPVEEDEESSDELEIPSEASSDIFFSNAERAVESIKNDKATPEQWIAMLEKNGGLKAGEDKWLGLSDWLKSSDKKTLTKQEVLDYIRQNKIQVEETNYGELDLSALQEEFNTIPFETNEALWDDADKRLADFYWEMQEKYGDDYLDKLNLSEQSIEENLMEERDSYEGPQDNIMSAYNAMLDKYGDDFSLAFTVNDRGLLEVVDRDAAAHFLEKNPINETRLSYTTPGLTNKREIALTVPTIESWNENDDVHFGDAGNGRAIAWVRFGDASLPGEELSEQEKERLPEYLKGKTLYHAPKRVLFIDEIQSKRHQEARDKGGYKPKSGEIAAKAEELNDIQRQIDEAIGAIGRSGNLKEAMGHNAEYKALVEKQEVARSDFNELRKRIGNPTDAPFEKNWHELAMKRMLRLAAEEGYDYVAWTTGEQQAERYNIGNLFSSIERQDMPDIYEGRRYILHGAGKVSIEVDENGNVLQSSLNGLEGRKLSEVVGKDIASQMMEMKNDEKIESDEFRLGAEGMKGFYDDILPRFMNKYGKKWGVSVNDDLVELNDGAKLEAHVIPVTPEMRESVLQGQPMFREGDTADLFNRAKDFFGETKDVREAGYVLPDGTMLDFSGRHMLDEGSDSSFLNGRRTTDHREVASLAYEKDGNTPTGIDTSMEDFIRRGAIRIDANGGVINLATKPTPEQRKALVQLIKRNGGDVYVDYGAGNTERYDEYENAYTTDVIADIDRFFDDPGREARVGLAAAELELTEKRLDDMSRELGIKINRVSREQMPKGHESDKGFYDPKTGEMSICMDNVSDERDAIATVLHETVGHHGLRKLLGAYFNDAMVRIHSLLDREGREWVNRYIASHNLQIGDTNAIIRGVEEYLSYLAESGDFQKSTWEKIKEFFGRLVDMILGTDGFVFTDNELNYILRASYENLKNPNWLETKEGKAVDTLMKRALGINESDPRYPIDPECKELGNLYRDGLTGTANLDYEALTGRTWAEIRRENQDADLPVRYGYETIQNEKGIKDIPEDQDYLTLHNLSSSRAETESHNFELFKFEPLLEQVRAIQEKLLGDKKGKTARKEAYDRVMDYMYAVSAIERNEYKNNEVEQAKQKALEEARKAADDARKALEEDVFTAALSDAEHKVRLAEIENNLKVQETEIEKEYEAKKRDWSGITDLMGRPASEWREAEDDARAMIDAFKAEVADDKALEELWKRVRACTDYSLDHAYNYGLLTLPEYEKLRGTDTKDRMWNYYLPLRGFNNETAEEAFSYTSFVGDTGRKDSPVVKKMKGRKTQADNPLANILRIAEEEIVQGNENRAKQALYRFVLNAGENSLLTEVEPWYVKDNATGKYMLSEPAPGQSLEDFEKDMEAARAAGNAHKGRRGLKLDQIMANKAHQNEHMIRLKVGGKDKMIWVNGNPALAKAVNGTGRKRNWQVVRNASRVLSNLFTTYSIRFAMKNLARDTVYSRVALYVKEDRAYRHQFTKNWIKNFGYGAFAIPMIRLANQWENGTLLKKDPSKRTKREQMFIDFMTDGGQTGYTIVNSVSKIKKEIERSMKRAGSKGHTFTIFGHYAKFAKALNEGFELLTRFTAYETSRDMGRSGQRAASDAKEISVNFNRRGAQDGEGVWGFIANYLGATHYFYNAGVQGFENFLRLFKINPYRMTPIGASFAIMGVMTPMINAMLAGLAAGGGDGDDDDDDKKKKKNWFKEASDEQRADWYWNLPEWVRRNNIILGTGNGYLAIPLPVELRAVYGLGDIAASLMQHKVANNDGFDLGLDVINLLGEVLPFNPVEGFSPSNKNVPDAIIRAVAPDATIFLVDWATNRDYTGRPLKKENPFGDTTPKSMGAYASTPKQLVQACQWLAEKTAGTWYYQDWAPGVVRDFLSNYGGGFYRAVEDVLKMYTGKFSNDPERPFRYDNIPFLSGLSGHIDEDRSNAYVSNVLHDYQRNEEDVVKQILSISGKKDISTEDIFDHPEKLDSSARLQAFLDGKKYQLAKMYREGMNNTNKWKQRTRTDKYGKKGEWFLSKDVEKYGVDALGKKWKEEREKFAKGEAKQLDVDNAWHAYYDAQADLADKLMNYEYDNPGPSLNQRAYQAARRAKEAVKDYLK